MAGHLLAVPQRDDRAAEGEALVVPVPQESDEALELTATLARLRLAARSECDDSVQREVGGRSGVRPWFPLPLDRFPAQPPDNTLIASAIPTEG